MEPKETDTMRVTVSGRAVYIAVKEALKNANGPIVKKINKALDNILDNELLNLLNNRISDRVDEQVSEINLERMVGEKCEDLITRIATQKMKNYIVEIVEEYLTKRLVVKFEK